MRYAILSDIHANLQAWNAVLLDIRSIVVDKIICLGDIVGYGPNPSEVLESVYANVDYFALGNHDAVVCNKVDPSLFNDTASEIIEWTKQRLNRNAARFLDRIPLALSGPGFRCTHGEFSNPGYFQYVLEPEDAMPSWQAVPEPLLFVGHSHKPGIYVLGKSGIPREAPLQDFCVEEEKRFMVNVGSVGQPRDGDARASYCIYEQDTGSVFFRRVPFDIDMYRSAVEKAGIPVLGSYFLSCDPRHGIQPIRAMLNFRPAESEDMAARNVEASQDLTRLQRSARLWKCLFASLAAAIVLAAVCGSWTAHRHATRKITIVGEGASGVVSASTGGQGANLLKLPDSPVSAGNPIPGWNVVLGDQYRQSVSTIIENNEAFFVLQSINRSDELSLLSPSFEVAPGDRLCAEALFNIGRDVDGTVAMVITAAKVLGDGRVQFDELVRRSPNITRSDGWTGVKRTVTMPAGTRAVSFSISGSFSGKVMAKDIMFTKRETTD